MQIAGYRNGYFERTSDIEEQIAIEIRDSQADMLFIGFGTPYKEKFIDDWKNIMNVPFSMGVGGTFDVTAGHVKRAPRWIQKIGMEWLYRLLQEPRRMWKRYAYTNPMFIYLVLKEKNSPICDEVISL